MVQFLETKWRGGCPGLGRGGGTVVQQVQVSVFPGEMSSVDGGGGGCTGM